MKIVIDLLPAVVFFAFYAMGDIYTATAAVIIACILQTFGYRLTAGRYDKSHLLTLGLALVFGGATLALRDPEFIKAKPTLIYGLMALAFLSSHFFGKELMVKRLLGKAFALSPPLWTRLNLCWVVFFVVQAGANVLVAANFGEAIWVNFKTFGDVALMLVFMLVQLYFLRDHLVAQEPAVIVSEVPDRRTGD